MKTTTFDLIVKKAKIKKDGCYRIRCVAYRVRSGKVTHMAAQGEIFEVFMGCLTIAGTYPLTLSSDEAGQKLLRKINV